MKQFDVVRVTRDFPKYGIKAGEAVALLDQFGQYWEVDRHGKSPATLPEDALSPMTEEEIASRPGYSYD